MAKDKKSSKRRNIPSIGQQPPAHVGGMAAIVKVFWRICDWMVSLLSRDSLFYLTEIVIGLVLFIFYARLWNWGVLGVLVGIYLFNMPTLVQMSRNPFDEVRDAISMGTLGREIARINQEAGEPIQGFARLMREMSLYFNKAAFKTMEEHHRKAGHDIANVDRIINEYSGHCLRTDFYYAVFIFIGGPLFLLLCFTLGYLVGRWSLPIAVFAFHDYRLNLQHIRILAHRF